MVRRGGGTQVGLVAAPLATDAVLLVVDSDEDEDVDEQQEAADGDCDAQRDRVHVCRQRRRVAASRRRLSVQRRRRHADRCRQRCRCRCSRCRRRRLCSSRCACRRRRSRSPGRRQQVAARCEPRALRLERREVVPVVELVVARVQMVRLVQLRYQLQPQRHLGTSVVVRQTQMNSVCKRKTTGQSIVTYGRIAAAHGSFNRIHQVALMRIDGSLGPNESTLPLTATHGRNQHTDTTA